MTAMPGPGALRRLVPALALAALSCATSVREPAPDDSVEPLPPPTETVRALPPWVADPSLHPVLTPARAVGVTGRSAIGPVDADNAALDALVDVILAAIDAAHRRALPQHRYFAYGGEFADGVAARLEPASALVAELFERARIDSSSRLEHDGAYYAFAYVDREEASGALARASARARTDVDEAVDIAMSAAEVDNWFGFVRWSRIALEREATRVALLVLRDALGERSSPEEFARPRRFDWVRLAAETLREMHGFTLHTQFEWEEPPPRQMEPRIKRHLMNELLDNELKVGFGEGCPTGESRPPVEWPEPVVVEADSTSDQDAGGKVAQEAEEEVHGPHHVVEIRSRGYVTRTALATWDAVVELTIEARSCESGPMVPQQSLGTLEGIGRDAQAAYLRALDWTRLDEEMRPRMREIDLLLPVELLGMPPDTMNAF